MKQLFLIITMEFKIQEKLLFIVNRMPYPYTIDDAIWWVSTSSKEGIVRPVIAEEQLVGCVGVKPGQFEESRITELGYWIGEPYWDNGYATEAVDTITNAVFSDTDIVRLFAPVFSPNLASMRVLEKCGYELEGVFRKGGFKNGEFYDKHIFARVKT